VRYRGIGVTRKIAIGKVFRFPDKILSGADTGGLPETVSAPDVFSPEREKEKLTMALEQSKRQIHDILQKIRITDPDNKNIDIIATQLGYFDDPAYNDDTIVLITDKGLSAAEAVQYMTRQLCDTFNSFDDDPYMRERASDIADAGERILNNLTGKNADIPCSFPPGTVVVAHDLIPSQTAQLDLDHVLGFVTEMGNITSHTAIMAHSMGIAAVVGCPEVMEEARDGDRIIVDARNGLVLLNPDDSLVEVYTGIQISEEASLNSAEAVKHHRILRSDGREVLVAANIGNLREAWFAKENGADGIGLFRTEFLFLGRTEMPGEFEQYEAYRQTAEIFGEEPVTVRTLDAGGDKALPYLRIPPEENPFLGIRAIRLCLQNPDIFKTQLRAILRASAYGNLRIMFPMICSIEELKSARIILRECMSELDMAGIPYRKNIAVGMMIETPAAAIQAREFAKEVDFFSIGTNDLTQYTLAVDRGNPLISGLYDGMNPAVQYLIKHTIEAACSGGIPCCMCGELAADPRAIPALAGYGLDEFSVAIDAIAETKARLLSLNGFHSGKLSPANIK
jgi:phosphotransferase system enzyme I (PtsI)